MSPYCECGIQQQYSLLCPSCKVAGVWDRRAEVELYLLEDVLQRWWKRYAVAHREAQSVSLSRFVIRVLSDDDHFHLVERTQVEGVEDKVSWGIACGVHIL